MHNKLISTFGRRKARKLRVTSQRAYEDILPLLKIESVQQIFKNKPPEIWLEIGFGGGEHLLEQLAKNPSVSVVGCEPFMNGVAKFLAHLSPEDYDRVRIWHEDARYLLDQLPPSFFGRAFILFPEPWPKKRQHHRRLITHEFMAKLLPTLKEGSLLYVASDDLSYVAHIQTVLYNHPQLVRREGPLSADPALWGKRPEGWPLTRYEEKAMTQGKKCAYMVFQKQENR